MAKVSLNVKVEIDLEGLDLEYDSMGRAIESEVMRQVRAEISEACKSQAKAAVKRDKEIQALIERVKQTTIKKLNAATGD